MARTPRKTSSGRKTNRPAARSRAKQVEKVVQSEATVVRNKVARVDWPFTTLVTVLMAILVAFGLYLVFHKPVIATNTTSTQQGSEVNYQGVDGKTALQILKDTHQVETKSYEGLGELVQSIDGVKPAANEYWIYYVNGEPATVGAGDYQTKSSDTITWVLQKSE